MGSLFTPSDRDALARRVSALTPSSTRQWGKMDVAQQIVPGGSTAVVPWRRISSTMITTGQPAAPFALQDAAGQMHRLEDWRGHWLLLVFHRHLG